MPADRAHGPSPAALWAESPIIPTPRMRNQAGGNSIPEAPRCKHGARIQGSQGDRGSWVLVMMQRWASAPHPSLPQPILKWNQC